jgi:hypothetical protein
MDAVLEFADKFVELPTLLVDEDRDAQLTLCVVKLAFRFIDSGCLNGLSNL